MSLFSRSFPVNRRSILAPPFPTYSSRVLNMHEKWGFFVFFLYFCVFLFIVIFVRTFFFFKDTYIYLFWGGHGRHLFRAVHVVSFSLFISRGMWSFILRGMLFV